VPLGFYNGFWVRSLTQGEIITTQLPPFSSLPLTGPQPPSLYRAPGPLDCHVTTLTGPQPPSLYRAPGPPATATSPLSLVLSLFLSIGPQDHPTATSPLSLVLSLLLSIGPQDHLGELASWRRDAYLTLKGEITAGLAFQKGGETATSPLSLVISPPSSLHILECAGQLAARRLLDTKRGDTRWLSLSKGGKLFTGPPAVSRRVERKLARCCCRTRRYAPAHEAQPRLRLHRA
jgi:hypothetical protein